MTELPENLRVVKLEEHSPETEAQPRRYIRERLNLYVKRRIQEHESPNLTLQQQQQRIHPTTNTSAPESGTTAIFSGPLRKMTVERGAVNFCANNTAPTTTSSKRKEKPPKDATKTRRPYQKRTEKTPKTPAQSQQLKDIIPEDGKSRKNKRQKSKQPNAPPITKAALPNNLLNSNSGSMPRSPNAEDAEGVRDVPEMEGRDTHVRDKEKCPDILGMVLSIKKRALLQDPEVQTFLKTIMNEFKN